MERNINVWIPLTHPLPGDLACNPDMCPDWELNQRPLALQASTQTNEPQQPGPKKLFKVKKKKKKKKNEDKLKNGRK